MLGSEISKDDNRSQGTIEENQMSESGSAAGSLLAEQGTETTSQVDPDDDDLTEDELLAQALAMSLNPPYTGHINIHIHSRFFLFACLFVVSFLLTSVFY
jgi:hypothetical protein